MKYFGTDGIRGRSFEQLNSELAYRVGQSIGLILKEKQIVIGLDTRESSDLLAYSVALGAMNSGVNVVFLGVVSTPILAKYSFSHQIPGIMITASHNPYHDNGIKLFINGYKSSEAIEKKVEDFIDNGQLIYADTKGQFVINNDSINEYLSIYNDFNLAKLEIKIGYDSANGANYLIANQIMSKYFSDSIQINNKPNGLNINEKCGSTHIEAITKHVLDNNLEIGFSFDGDGDRVLVVDGDGKLYDGDKIIYIIAKYLKIQNKLKNNTVVLTKMSNPGIIKALKELDINVSLVDVGDKYVFAEMIKNDYILGGENSGHIIMRDLLHTGDGLLVAIRLLQILKDTKQTLKELTKDLVLYPQKMVNISNIDKRVLNNDKIKEGIKKTKERLGDDSLLLVRASGTEPLIRVTISCADEKILNKEMDFLVSLIEKSGRSS